MNTHKLSAGFLAVMTLIPVAGVFAQTTDSMAKKDDTMTMEKKDMMAKETTASAEQLQMEKDKKMLDKGMMTKDAMNKQMTKKQKMQMKKDMMKKKMMEKKEMMMKEIQMKKDKVMMKDGENMKKAGTYMTINPSDLMAKLSMTDKNIIFFHASWCPTCAAADKSLNAAPIKMGYNVLRVDYDTSTDLKKKYGVTTQHTFVQVDSKGEMIASWRGGSAADLYKNAK